MNTLDKIFTKLFGVSNVLCTRTNSYHYGGSASEGLSTDSELTLGLDDRAEVTASECVALACLLVFVAMFFPILMTHMP